MKATRGQLHQLKKREHRKSISSTIDLQMEHADGEVWYAMYPRFQALHEAPLTLNPRNLHPITINTKHDGDSRAAPMPRQPRPPQSTIWLGMQRYCCHLVVLQHGYSLPLGKLKHDAPPRSMPATLPMKFVGGITNRDID